MSLSEDALKDFSDTTTETDKDQTNKSSLFFGKKYESVLQRVQLTQHFTHYTKNLKDKDWAENIGIMQQQPQQTQIEEQEEENLTSDKQQIQIQSAVIIKPQLSIPINFEDMQNFTQIQQNQIIPIDQESPLLLSPKINNITKMEIEQEFELPGSPTFYASSHQPISNFPTVKLSLCENILPYRSLDDRLIKNKPGAIPLIASNDDEEAEIDDTFEIVDIQEEKDLY
ncbi:MAG: hypothetical protein EZS28_004481 [Streblomastix strix]|uniref:Uncharacterized protein n=1 Tax=Streblomastix strix TaxID=222440 RepID=A0A5J4X064_9EUKA|nr:MAG: hypothetical protein EZS28_004481 [Streblomastix strix]